MKEYKRRLWWTATVAGLLFVPTFVCFALLESFYFEHSPREPHPETGLIGPYSVKGVKLYVTETQANVAAWLFRFDVGMLGVLAVCGMLSGGLDLSRRP